MASTVQVGAPTDTGPTYTLTITRDSADTVTDWTTATTVVLIIDDAGTTKTVTKTSATTSQWIGTIKYGAWFTASGVFPTRARATFSDTTQLTLPDELNFSVL